MWGLGREASIIEVCSFAVCRDLALDGTWGGWLIGGRGRSSLIDCGASCLANAVGYPSLHM